MQKQFLLAAAFTCIMAIPAHSNAQAVRRTLIYDASRILDTKDLPATGVTNKAMQDFRKNYPLVTGESWHAMDGGWEATFVQDQIRSVVFYDQHGNWNYSIRYYSEQKTPAAIKQQLRNTYSSGDIMGVEEVHTRSGVTYLIHLQDANSWKKVRVNNGTVDLLEEYPKA